jgi:uncharacterized repeat protein (TIGR03803 family)
VTTISNVISGADGGGPDDSESPGKGLTLNSYDGYMYGTTATGGSDGNGTIYKLNTAMYGWSITNGTITGPTNTPSIQWTPTGTGTVNICLTISDFSACTTQICTTVIAYTGAIAAGGDHSLAILTNGSLWAWGEDDHGQLGDGESSDEVTPEPVGDPLCGLPSLSNAVALAAGSDFSIAIDNNGLVWTWGDGSDDNGGELGNGGGTNTSIPASINLSNVVAVAAGHSHALALRADGTVWAWGSDVDDDGDDNQGVLGVGSFFADLGSYSTNMPVESLIPSGAYITSIAAGNYWSLALDSYGRVWGWGNNANGQLGISPDVLLTTNVPVLISGISNVVAVAAGWQHAIAITADKTLWTWGHNGSGELGQGSTFSYSTSPIQVVASGLSNNVVAIAGGNQFTLAVTSNGQLFAFGSNNHSQLGTNNGGALIPAPTLVAGISNVVLASAPPMTEDGNGCHSLAVAFGQGTSQYYGWGYDSDGQAGCGLAEDDDQYTPARIPFCNACSSCVQLGTSNVFTAQCTGTLKLYFNDDYYYNDNYGEYIVTITGLGLTSNVTVSALASNGVAVGIVSNGVTYTCVASGWCNSGDLPSCTNTNIPCGCDPNGKFSDTGEPPFECPASATYGMTKAVCPYLQCLSLVGRIE